MNSTKLPLVVAGLIVSACLGYYAGTYSAMNDDPAAENGAKSPGVLPAQVPEEGTQQSIANELHSEKRYSVSEIFNLESRNDVYESLEDYLEGLTSENVGHYLAELDQLPPSSRKKAMLLRLYGKWSEIDGVGAFEHAKAVAGRDRISFISKVLGGWAKTDSQAAWQAYLEASGEGAMLQISPRSIISAIAEKDMREAVRLALSVSEAGVFKGRGISTLVYQASEKGEFTELVGLIDELGTEQNKGEAMKRLFQKWSEFEFEGPLASIEGIEDSELSGKAMEGFLEGWAQADGRAAFLYAAENQDNPVVEKSLSRITSNWIRSATADEIDGIVEDVMNLKNKDKVVSSLIYSVGSAKPETAMRLAMSVEDSELRKRNVSTAVSVWSRTDIAAADAFVKTIGSEDERAGASRTLAYAHIRNGADPSVVLGYVDEFERAKSRQHILEGIVNSATSSSNKTKSQDLITLLKAEIPEHTEISEESRQKMMERLNKN